MNRSFLVALALGLVTAAWARSPRPERAHTEAVVVEPLDPALAALRSELRAWPLAERCSLTRVLAERVVTAHDWLKDIPVRDGRVGFAVLLPEDVPLLAEGEHCVLEMLTRQTNGQPPASVTSGSSASGSSAPAMMPSAPSTVTVTLDPAKIEGRYLFVDWTPEPLRAGQPLRFGRRAIWAIVPQLNIPRHARMRMGRTMMYDGEAPDLEIEALRKQDTWVLSMRLSFSKRSVPARLAPDGDGGSK